MIYSRSEIKDRWYSPIDRTLRRELKSHFGSENIGLIPWNIKN